MQGNVVTGTRLMRLASPVSFTPSRVTFRAVKPIETWQLINTLILGKGRYLVLLQNTDEIRATGGFIGSYTVLDFGSQTPLQLEIHDMYNPSGVSMTLPSPAGQNEYLSEGKGMKLIDANWHPDFPTSARTILQYFENIKNDPQRYDGVIAVTLPTIEELVATLGGIYLADQQQTVTADTLAEVMRADRGEFFSGSKDKEQSLQSFYTALKLRLAELSLAEWRLIFRALKDNLALEMQLYSQDKRVQEDIGRAGFVGGLKAYDSDEIYLFPVESNVGINKANRKIGRELIAQVEDKQLTVTTQFNNAYTEAERPALPENPAYDTAPHLAYVNYYRLLVRPDMMLETIKIDDQPLSEWDDELITSAAGLEYRQIGFLVVVPEENKILVQAQFALPELKRPKLVIQRQVGLKYQAITESIE